MTSSISYTMLRLRYPVHMHIPLTSATVKILWFLYILLAHTIIRNINSELGCHTWARPGTAITSTNHLILVSRARWGHWFTDTTRFGNTRIQARSFANVAVATGAVVRSKLELVRTGFFASNADSIDIDELFGAKQFRNVSASAPEEIAAMLLGSVRYEDTDQCHQ